MIAIKQNEFEVEKCDCFGIFFGGGHFLLAYCLGFQGENPTEIGQLVPKIQTVEGLNKQYETKETIGFVWLYLKNSICKLRLILLDHITFFIFIYLFIFLVCLNCAETFSVHRVC